MRRYMHKGTYMTAMTEPIKKGKRVTGEERDALAADLKRRYEGGETIRQLHDATGRSFGAIQRLLSEAGVTMRPRGGANRVKASA